MSNFFYNAYLNFLKLDHITDYDVTTNNNIQIIGYYDMEKNLWFNAWAIYLEPTKENKSNNIYKYKKSKDLLLWALNIENDLNGISPIEKNIIKTIICSSKLYITDCFKVSDPEDSIQLEILLSVICYLIKAKKINWSYNKNNFITVFVEL